jgi:hypothetical protein
LAAFSSINEFIETEHSKQSADIHTAVFVTKKSSYIYIIILLTCVKEPTKKNAKMRIFNEIVELTMSNSGATSSELPVWEVVIGILPDMEVYGVRASLLESRDLPFWAYVL